MVPGAGARGQSSVALRAVPVATKIKLADLKVGQKFKGVVVFLTHGGAFVDIGAEACGLLHSSVLAYSIPVKEGQEVEVYIDLVNVGTRKFNVCFQRNAGWPKVSPKLKDVLSFQGVPPGQWLEGKLASYPDRGCTVAVPAPNSGAMVEGYVPDSEMTDDFGRFAKVGQSVRVRVVKVEEAKRKVSLSMKEMP